MHPKQAAQPRRVRKAVPVLRAAGLSLSLASGASMASPASSPDSMTHNAAASPEVVLREEEVFDESLATFHVFDNESARPFRAGERPIAFGGACCQFACLGGQSSSGSENTPGFGNDAYSTTPRPVRPAQKHIRKKPGS
jgi:hypothetical protein